MIDAVVDVIARLAVADGLAHDARDGVAGGGDHEAAGLGEDLDVLREETVDLGVDDLREIAEGLHGGVVRRGEAAADVDEIHLLVAAVLRLLEDVGRERERLDVVLEVRGLAADVEADALDGEADAVGLEDHVDGLAGRGAELRGQLDHRAGVGNLETEGETGVGRVLLDLVDLLDVVEGHERLVLVELLEGGLRLDRVGVDDLVPDPVLPLLGRHALDVLVHGLELGHRGDVEAGALLEERLHDLGQRVGLHGEVGLHAGQVALEGAVVLPELVVVDDEERRAVFLGELLELGLRDHVGEKE